MPNYFACQNNVSLVDFHAPLYAPSYNGAPSSNIVVGMCGGDGKFGVFVWKSRQI